MKKIFVLLTLVIPAISFAQSRLHNVSPYEYQKPLFEAASALNISGGTPVDKQSFQMLVGKKSIGTIIAGKGFNQNDDSVCFIGWMKNNEKAIKVTPTIGFERWEAEKCLGTEAVSLLSYKGSDKVAVIYEAASPNATAYESVIFTVEGSDLVIDQSLTKSFGSQGAKTIGELKSLIKN